MVGLRRFFGVEWSKTGGAEGAFVGIKRGHFLEPDAGAYDAGAVVAPKQDFSNGVNASSAGDVVIAFENRVREAIVQADDPLARIKGMVHGADSSVFCSSSFTIWSMDLASSSKAWASIVPLLFMRRARTLRDQAPPVDFMPLTL